MTLSQKTQKRVLGWSAGVPCEVASGLRSHGFEAEADTSRIMKRAVRPCDERHMLSGFKEGDRKDNMISENYALSDSENAHCCKGACKNSEKNAACKIVRSVGNTDRCDDSIEYNGVNATCGVSSDVEKANRYRNSCENVENASCELGTGRVVCPSVEDCEVRIVRRQRADCKLGTGGVECP